MDSTYEVTLALAAARVILGLPDPKELIYCLSTELLNGPNAEKEVRFDRNVQIIPDRTVPRGFVYTATPLSFDGFTALWRPMTASELGRLGKDHGRLVVAKGLYVVDILAAESAFARRPRRL